MFNNKLKEELKRLRKENEELTNKVSRMENAILNYKINYLRQKRIAESFSTAVQLYIFEKTGDSKLAHSTFREVNDMANKEFDKLDELDKKDNYKHGTIDFIKY
jgi:hypothetical protein